MEIKTHQRLSFGKSDAIRSYFASGWLPFFPYLILYLLFWGLGSSISFATITFTVLHFVHAAFLFALLLRDRGIFRDPRLWFFISVGIIFLYQGASMEFPNDNWTHVRRIFSWGHIGSFSDPVPYDKYKSGFFFLYSLVGWISLPFRQVALSGVAAMMATLIAYQIWRFLRAVGLSDVAAFLGVLAALLFMGTPIQFFGYYSLSSSGIGMIGSLAALSCILTPTRFRLPLGIAAVLLGTFNHIQSLGIIMLGAVAIACWKAQLRFGTARVLATLSGSALLLFFAAALVVSYLPAGQNYWQNLAPIRSAGWLTPLGSFPIWEFHNLEVDSPSTRFLEIVTWLGLINFAAAAILIARRRILGWITIAPLVALLYPVSASLIADAIVADPSRSIKNIITFHRYFLLALPLAAVIDLAAVYLARFRVQNSSGFKKSAAAVFGAAAILFAAIPSGRHWLGKLGTLGCPTPELARLSFLEPVAAQLEAGGHFVPRKTSVIADPATSTFLATHLGIHSFQFRLDLNDGENPVFGNVVELSALIGAFPDKKDLLVIVPRMEPQIPLHYSSTGFISRHWRTFAINTSFQFDPDTLRWCEENLTPIKGWQSFDLDPWHRCFSRHAFAPNP